MPHKTMEIVKCSHDELVAALNKNVGSVYTPLEPVSYTESDLKTVLKKEAPDPVKWLGTIRNLEVEQYLSEEALALYNSPLGSTVHEFYQNKNTGEVLTRSQTQSESFGDEWDQWDHRTSLVRFMSKMVIGDADGRVPDQTVERWARVLNWMAANKHWRFGTLGPALAMPLMVLGDGTPLLSADEMTGTVISQIMSPQDPRINTYAKVSDEELKRRFQEKKRQVVISTYICVSEELDPYRIQTTAAMMNDKLGVDLFVEEGMMPTMDWKGLPA
jgi:hypothetical protein